MHPTVLFARVMSRAARRVSGALVAAVFAALVVSAEPDFARAQTTWLGNGADTSWGTSSNWSTALSNNFNAALVFDGSKNTSNTNTLTGGTATSITFAAGAGAFTIGGNAISLSGNLANNSANLQTLGLSIALTNSSTFTGTSVTLTGTLTNSGGSRTLANNIASGGLLTLGSIVLSEASATTRTLTLSGTGNTTITGSISNGSTSASTFTITNSGTTTLSGSSNWAGNLNVQAGSVIFSGTSGINSGATTYKVQGGRLILDNTGAGNNNNNRLADTSAITIGAGSFIYRGSDQAGTNSTETIGAITNSPTNGNGSGGVITVSYGGTNLAKLTAASFAYTAGNGTTLVNGLSLGKNSTDTGSVGKLILTTAPTLVGTTAASTSGINASAQNTQIVPHLLGEATATSGGVGTATGTANTFLTYNASTGLRPLNPTQEFTNNAITTGNNTYITSLTAASTSDTINSLVINGGDLTIADSGTVTNSSGALLFASSNAIRPAGTTGAMSFAREAMISVNAGITGTLSAPITGASAVTYSGAGTLAVNGVNTYSGPTTVNPGVSLILGNKSAFGSGTVTLNAVGSGTVTLQASTDLTGTNAIANYVNWFPYGSVVQVTGSNSIEFSGTVNQNNTNQYLYLTNNLSSNATLTFSNSINLGSTSRIYVYGTGNTEFSGSSNNQAYAFLYSTGTTWLTGTNTGAAAFIFGESGGSNQGSGATYIIGNASALGTGNVAINQSSVIQAQSDVTFGNNFAITRSSTFQGSNAITISGTLSSAYNPVLTNNLSGKTLTLNGPVTLSSNANAYTLSIAGTGNTTINGVISNGTTAGVAACNFTISNTGTTTLSVANTYTGVTTVSAGVLRLNSANALPGGIESTGGSSALTVNGGVIGLGNGNFARGLGTGTNQVQITGGGGFAAYGDNRTVNLGGNATPSSLTWGSGNFITAGGSVFILGAAGATHTIDFQNPIALGSAVRTIRVDDGSADVDASLSGLLSSASAGNGLTKTGLGTLDLTAPNSFTGTLAVQNGAVRFTSLAAGSGAQNLGAGTLVNLGIAATSAGEIDYRGGGGTLDKNISALGSGRNRIRNSGGGTLTLSGTLTKNGTILELAGGTFTVSGRITGTSANSDLYVNNASVTLSNTNNDYNGPTYVYGNGTLSLGASNVIPAGSILILGGTGSDTGTGTLNLSSYSDAVAGLSFGAGGGTLKMAASQTAAPQLATSSSLSLGAGTALDLTGMGTSAGLYKLVSYTSNTGTFATVSGLAAGYQLVYGTTALDAQQKAVLGTVTVTNPVTSIITGGSAAFSYTVANGAASGGASLLFTGSGNANVVGSSNGSAAADGSSTSVAGLYFTGTGVGSGQTGTFNVNAPDAYGITAATGTVSVTVLDHAISSLSSASTPLTAMSISLGQWNYSTQTWESGSNAGAFSIYNLASQYGANLTADLSLLGVTGSGNGFSTNLLDTLATIAGGTSSQFSIFFNPTGLSASGTQSTTFAISTSDKTGMSGATVSNTLYVTASVVVVPEPDTIIFAGIGIAMAGWTLWKRRRIARILQK